MAAEHLGKAFPPFHRFPPSRSQRLAIRLGQRLPPTYLGQRVAGWIRGYVQASAESPVDVEVLGVRMRLRLNDNSCERRLFVTPHFFEPASLNQLSRRLKANVRFVDVGANIGTYALLAAQAGGKGAKVLAIEPNPNLVNRLRENIFLNDFEVAVEQVAASDFNGKTTLRRDGNNLGASSTVPKVKVRWQEPSMDVDCAKIFDLVRKHGFDRIDVMKLDIEGGEDRALMAFLIEAPEHLWPRFLLIEESSDVWKWDLKSELVSRGWSPVQGRGNLMFER